MRALRLAAHAALALALGIGTIAATGGEALAQNAPDQAEARTLFDDGVRLFKAGDFPAACSKLEASYHLFAGIGTRGKLAECYEKVGRTASAWAMYREVAALAGKAGDATRESVARDRAAALEPKLAHLTVVVPPPADIPGLVVKRGGETVERGAVGTPVPVDAGTLHFEIGATGRVTKTADLPVSDGQSVTFTVPELDEAPVPPPAPVAPPPLAPADSAPPPAEATRSWQRPTAIAVGAAGVVTVVVGAALALTAKSSYDGAFSGGHCDRGSLTCDPTGQSQIDGARSQANVGGIVLGVGAVVAVGGAVLFFTAPRPVTTTTGWRLVPEVGPRSAGLTIAGGF
jgi:hypothetical protein